MRPTLLIGKGSYLKLTRISHMSGVEIMATGFGHLT